MYRSFTSSIINFGALLSILFLLICCLRCVNCSDNEDIDDNDFADFVEFDEPEEEFQVDYGHEKSDTGPVEQPPDETEGEVEVEEEDTYIDHEEYENYADDGERKPEKEFKPSLSIADIPKPEVFFYLIEVVLSIFAVSYFLCYFMGRNLNAEIAKVWFEYHSSLLNENFSLVGDDTTLLGTNDEGGMTKITDYVYALWCSGRVCCEGMLVELKLLRRQDILCYLTERYALGCLDEMRVTCPLSKDDMDNYVFCVVSKRAVSKYTKDMIDLNTYCPEKKNGEKYGLPPGFLVMNEIGEVAANFFDSRTLAFFNRFGSYIDYIHISDRFSGRKSSDESESVKVPEYKKMFLIGFSTMADGGTALQFAEKCYPFMQTLFYWLEKVKRYHLSKEGKLKSDKNRAKQGEAYLKSINTARNEAAALRKEEKRRQEKEKILQEDDPEKQRRWEEKEMKRQMKKKQPKMKQLRVKSV